VIGFRILPRSTTVSAHVVKRFKALPVANVSDAISRMFSGGPRLRPMHRAGQMAGPALTVKTRPGDNLMIHKALDIAIPGDVVVVDAGGDLTNALIGELMVFYAASRKVAGIVINGAIRDAGIIRENDLPVYAAGVTHRGPYKDGPGEINVPIAVDGMVIHPGDLVIGDEDGILSVRPSEAEAILAATEKKHAAETNERKAIEEGRWDRAWVDARLKQLGCEGV
jgi:RraA family protein